MNERWTIKELGEASNEQVLVRILNERINKLHPYTPLAKRLIAIRGELDRKIQEQITKAKP